MANELDALDPVPEEIKLSTGTVVAIQPLRARQFFKFLRIVTHGALPLMNDMSLFQMDDDMSQQEFTGRLLSVMLLSIPDAEDETVEFIRSMVEPAGLITGRKLNKQDSERNAELTARVDAELDNPELDDLVSIIEAIVKREAADIQALGKRLAGMFKLAQKTGQIPEIPQQDSPSPSPTSPEPNSSAGSPELSISYPPNTAGTTTVYTTSTSGGSGSVWLQSGNASTTSNGETNSG